jgi:hypothetical protein
VIALGTSVQPANASPTRTYGWAQTSTLPTGSGNNVLIGCPTTGYCWGTTGFWSNASDTVEGGHSYVLTTSDDGANWTNSPIGVVEEASVGPNSQSDNQPLQPTAVTCVPGTSTCYSVAWAPQEFPTNLVPSEFEYIDSNTDFVSGDLGSYVSDLESTYYGDAVSLSDLSCPALDQCNSIGIMGRTVTSQLFGPQFIQVPQLFQGGNDVAAWTNTGPFSVSDGGPISTENVVSCTSATLCWVAGYDNTDTPGGPVLSTNAGGTWAPVTSPDPAAPIDQLTCLPGANADDRSEATCYAEVNDGGPQFYSSTDGGTTWSADSLVDANNRGIQLSGNTHFNGITCPSTVACLAYGVSSAGTGELLVTINGGATWTPETVPGSTNISSASCPSVTECYLGGGLSNTTGAVWTSTDLGLSQAGTQPVTDLQATGGLDSVTATWTAPDPNGNFGRGAPYQNLDVVATPQGAGSKISDVVGPTATTDTLYGLTPGITYDIEVTPGYPSNGSFQATGTADDVFAVPTAVAETGTSSASGSNPSPAPVTAGGGTVASSSVGSGTVSIGSYASDPEAGLAAGSSYFDVAASGSFTSVTIDDCSQTVGLPLQWWNSGAGGQDWEDVSPPATISGGCLSWTASATSSPSVSELYGTAFSTSAASALTAPTAPTISNLPTNGPVGGSFLANVSTNGDGVTSVTSNATGVCTVGTNGFTVTYVAVGTCSLTAHVAAGSTYASADGTTQSFAVVKGISTAPAITNLPASPTYGSSFTAVISTSGGGATSVTSATATTCSVVGTKVSFVGLGTCKLRAHVAADANYYAASGAKQVLTVTKGVPAPPSISHLPTSPTYGSSFKAKVAGSSGGIKSVTSSTHSVCTVAGLEVTFVGVGTCTLTAHEAASTDYLAAKGPLQTFAVARATPTRPSITNLLAAGSKGRSLKALVETTGDGAKSVTSSTPSVCTTSGLKVSFVSKGTCRLTAHVAMGLDYLAGDGVAQKLKVT